MNEQPDDELGRRFWICAVLGLGIVGFGIAGLLRNVHGPALQSWAKLIAGGLVLHDGIALPLVALLAAVLVRLLPARPRAPLQGALVVSAIVALVAFPVVSGKGRLANNPSLLPSDHYGANLLGVLAVVWAVALVLALWPRRGRRHLPAERQRAST